MGKAAETTSPFSWRNGRFLERKIPIIVSVFFLYGGGAMGGGAEPSLSTGLGAQASLFSTLPWEACVEKFDGFVRTIFSGVSCPARGRRFPETGGE